ncbi:LOW QUALITY PROTEIN: rhodopirellula transposase, partial [Streptomyces sp. e14]
ARRPMSPLRWTVKSTRTLAAELTRQGYRVSADTVGDLLREEGFSPQAGAKTIEGKQHPDRDAQFRYINERAKQHMDAGQPVISVDAKKKELVGEYKDADHQWRPAGEPVMVKTQRFPGPAGTGQGDPLQDLRHRRECRLGECRHRSRHRRVRCRLDPPLVAGPRPARLSGRHASADHRGRGRVQRLPHPGLQDRTRSPGHRDRPVCQKPAV